MATVGYAPNSGTTTPRRRQSTRPHLLFSPSTISLFSGAGGLDLGFAAAGFDVRLSVDIDGHSCRTLRRNSGCRPYLSNHPVLQEDICRLSSDAICEAAGIRKGAIELVIGGPPCQAFSVFGRRGGLSDPRGNLVWEFLRIVQDLQPKAFVFENVAGLRSIHGGELYDDLLGALSCGGRYRVSDHAYNVVDYGVPQFRQRIIFIGLTNGNPIEPMPPTHSGNDGGLPQWRTVEQALAGIPELGDATLNSHRGRIHSQRIIERYAALAFGERDPKTRINKLDPKRPSFTIIVGSDAGGGKGHVHPHSPREVTPRESARIQTFPDWWEFDGVGRHVIRQVGNAVPPLFAAQLAGYVGHQLYGSPRISWDDAVALLELDHLR